MNKIQVAALAFSTVLLAACNGGNPTVDPLSQNFTATGTGQWTPPATATLTHTFPTGGKTMTVGTYDVNKNVNITITADQVKSLTLLNGDDFKYNMGSNCDSSGLSVYSGMQYYRFISTDIFTINGNKSYIKPQTKTTNSDGTISYADRHFIYVTTGGIVSGAVVCPTYTVNVNISLKPGWNVVQETYTYHPTTGLYTNDFMTLISNSNSDTGPWRVYDGN